LLLLLLLLLLMLLMLRAGAGTSGWKICAATRACCGVLCGVFS
jgi:hypothetical protein